LTESGDSWNRLSARWWGEDDVCKIKDRDTEKYFHQLVQGSLGESNSISLD